MRVWNRPNITIKRRSCGSEGKEETTYFTGEGHEVVLAEGEDVNITNNDHLIMVFREDGIIYNV